MVAREMTPERIARSGLLRRRIVLVADDDPIVRLLVVLSLGCEQYLILQACNSDEAVQLARLLPPDVMLLDVYMPGADGFEVCRLLKAEPATAASKVVMLTAMGDEVAKYTARQAGADAHFVKPFSPLALLAKVESMLEERPP